MTIDVEAMDKAAWDSLTPEEKVHNDHITELSISFSTVMATNTLTGQTEEYYFAEHFNIGPGWMMMRCGNPALGIVSSFNLKDVTGSKPREDRSQTQTHRFD